MKIKELPNSEKPREKLLKYGKENLSNSELLALILKTGTKDMDVMEVAICLLKQLEKLSNLKYMSYEVLTSIKGIGHSKAIELLALSEIAKRIYYEKDENEHIVMSNPKLIYKESKYLFDGLNQEHFYAFYLNSKKGLIERKLLFMGTVNKSVVHPREIFKEAYRLSASSIVCLHNHPSGDVVPSVEDIELTRALVEIGKLNGIPVVDHLIIGKDKYYSFYEKNRHIGIL